MKIKTIIDIGSSKVSCCVVSPGSRGTATFRSFNSSSYSGFRLNSMPNMGGLSQALSDVIGACESVIKQKITNVTVGVPAPFAVTQIASTKLESQFGGSKVCDEDIDKIIRLAQPMNPPSRCTLIHSTPFDYVINGNQRVDNPVGMTVQTLEARVSHIFVEDYFIKLIEDCLSQLKITVNLFVATSLADSHYLITDEVKRNGAILLDCGGRVTDVSFIRNNAVQEIISIDIGGKDITDELSDRLCIPQSIAEKIKCNFDFYDYDENSYFRVFVPNEGYVSIRSSVIATVIDTVISELAHNVRYSIDELIGNHRDIPIFITGGAVASFNGGIELFSSRLGRKVFSGIPRQAFVDDGLVYSKISAYALAEFMLFDNISAAQTDDNFISGLKQILVKKP